ncbi:MAG: energy transducer TonB [Rhodanobacteraceae bacterium]
MARFAWRLLMALAVPGLAFAHGGVDAAKRSVEGSMLVTGEIAVNPDGGVYGYSLDHRDKLPPAVVNLIDQTLTGWKFTPVKVNGKPELAKAFMSLRIVAKQIDAKHDAISVESAAFGAETTQAHKTSDCANVASVANGACLTYLTRRPPDYPRNLINDLVSGTVYLVLEVDRQGRVAQVAVEQVDLREIADGATLGRWRRELGDVSLAAARKWTFQVPQAGSGEGWNHWIVFVPVNYAIDVFGQKKKIGEPDYGQWDAYVPGPVNSIPWLQEQRGQIASNGNADAIPDDGTPFIADTRFVLLTPISGDGAAKSSPAANPGQG